MPRSSLSTAFEHVSLPHGDDGRKVRGILARCGGVGCTAAVPLPVNTIYEAGSQSSELEWRFIAKKLEAKGWSIGRRRQDHRCPRCGELDPLLSCPEHQQIYLQRRSRRIPQAFQSRPATAVIGESP